VLPQTALFRVDGSVGHCCVQVGEVAISDVVAPFSA